MVREKRRKVEREIEENEGEKDKRVEEFPSSPLLPDLPNDVAIQCVARIPRLYLSYPNLSLVSKAWHSLLRSPLFFTLQSNLKQQFLYINLSTSCSSPNDYKWFSVNLNSKTISSLPPIPYPDIDPDPELHLIQWASSCVTLGHKIFIIGGGQCGVWIFDSQLNKWEIGPKLRVGRELLAGGVIDGKIYVIGGGSNSDPWAEVFDPTVGSWVPLPNPALSHDRRVFTSCTVFGDKLYAVSKQYGWGVVFDPVGSPSQWGCITPELLSGWEGIAAAVVDGILYCWTFSGPLQGYDFKENRWKELTWVGDYLLMRYASVRMTNVGGRLFVVWSSIRNGDVETKIMCAEVAVWKHSSGELRGSIVWSDDLMVVPGRSFLSDCLGVEL